MTFVSICLHWITLCNFVPRIARMTSSGGKSEVCIVRVCCESRNIAGMRHDISFLFLFFFWKSSGSALSYVRTIVCLSSVEMPYYLVPQLIFKLFTCLYLLLVSLCNEYICVISSYSLYCSCKYILKN